MTEQEHIELLLMLLRPPVPARPPNRDDRNGGAEPSEKETE